MDFRLRMALPLLTLSALGMAFASWRTDNMWIGVAAVLVASGVALILLGELRRPEASCGKCGNLEPWGLDFCHRCGWAA